MRSRRDGRLTGLWGVSFVILRLFSQFDFLTSAHSPVNEVDPNWALSCLFLNILLEVIFCLSPPYYWRNNTEMSKRLLQKSSQDHRQPMTALTIWMKIHVSSCSRQYICQPRLKENWVGIEPMWPCKRICRTWSGSSTIFSPCPVKKGSQFSW